MLRRRTGDGEKRNLCFALDATERAKFSPLLWVSLERHEKMLAFGCNDELARVDGLTSLYFDTIPAGCNTVRDGMGLVHRPGLPKRHVQEGRAAS